MAGPDDQPAFGGSSPNSPLVIVTQGYTPQGAQGLRERLKKSWRNPTPEFWDPVTNRIVSASHRRQVQKRLNNAVRRGVSLFTATMGVSGREVEMLGLSIRERGVRRLLVEMSCLTVLAVTVIGFAPASGATTNGAANAPAGQSPPRLLT